MGKVFVHVPCLPYYQVGKFKILLNSKQLDSFNWKGGDVEAEVEQDGLLEVKLGLMSKKIDVKANQYSVVCVTQAAIGLRSSQTVCDMALVDSGKRLPAKGKVIISCGKFFLATPKYKVFVDGQEVGAVTRDQSKLEVPVERACEIVIKEIGLSTQKIVASASPDEIKLIRILPSKRFLFSSETVIFKDGFKLSVPKPVEEDNPSALKKAGKALLKHKRAIMLGVGVVAALAGADADAADVDTDVDVDDDMDFGDDDMDFETLDTDGDGFADTMLVDEDGDGIADAIGMDTDGDGLLDSFGVDTDGDGALDTFGVDSDGDGMLDTVGADIDGDGTIDAVGLDTDGNGTIDMVGVDTDGDGSLDTVAVDTSDHAEYRELDTDGDGMADTMLVDSDGDGVADAIGMDTDGDGRLDAFGADTDGDGTLDTFGVDSDGDGMVDTIGVDSDGDGAIDTVGLDTDGDGTFDTVGVDTDGNGSLDTVGVDTDGDGSIDTVGVDMDGDGTIDRIGVDTDGDGTLDRVGDVAEKESLLEKISPIVEEVHEALETQGKPVLAGAMAAAAVTTAASAKKAETVSVAKAVPEEEKKQHFSNVPDSGGNKKNNKLLWLIIPLSVLLLGGLAILFLRPNSEKKDSFIKDFFAEYYQEDSDRSALFKQTLSPELMQMAAANPELLGYLTDAPSDVFSTLSIIPQENGSYEVTTQVYDQTSAYRVHVNNKLKIDRIEELQTVIIPTTIATHFNAALICYDTFVEKGELNLDIEPGRYGVPARSLTGQMDIPEYEGAVQGLINRDNINMNVTLGWQGTWSFAGQYANGLMDATGTSQEPGGPEVRLVAAVDQSDLERKLDEVLTLPDVPGSEATALLEAAERALFNLPDHSSFDQVEQDCYTAEFRDLLRKSFEKGASEVVEDGIGDDEFLAYWYDGNGDAMDLSSRKFQIRAYDAKTASVKLNLTYADFPEEGREYLMLFKKEAGKWLLDDWIAFPLTGGMKASCRRYLDQ